MNQRKFFLDWLRVLAFALLAVFHTGMLYVTWHYNLKSPRIVPELEWAMNAVGPWRMALLFVISGVASRFLIDKLGAGRFTLDRLARLLPVITVGMLVVIPPQTWIELTDKGVTHAGYLEFWWSSYLAADQTLVRPLGKTMPTWDHLWFLVYLLVYVLLFALAFAVTGGRKGVRRAGKGPPLALLLTLPALWLIAFSILIETTFPFTHGLWDDPAADLKWLGMFGTGVWVAMREDFWAWVQRHRAGLALLSAGLLGLHLAGLALLRSGALDPDLRDYLPSIPAGLYAWAMVLTLFGFAGRYLDRPSAALSYLNEAVLPVYVLHQPILLLSAYVVFPLALPLGVEAALLVAVTGLGSLALYHVAIRPFAVTRFLFGLKPKVRREAPVAEPA